VIIVTDKNMKTKDQLEHELENAKQSLGFALEELNAWEKLKIIGETPEKVYEFWRKNQIKMFKYQREMIMWREKYNQIRLT
jgi:hypothetical protein